MASSLAFGQQEALEKAREYEAIKAYVQAIDEYEKAVKQGATTPEVYRKLANYNLQMRRPEESHKWFEKLLETRDYSTEDQLLFAEVLRQNEKYFEATIWSAQYFMATGDEHYEQFVVSEDYYERFKLDSAKITIVNLDKVNSEFNEICPTIKDDVMYFSSNMDFEFGIRHVDVYTNSNFLNLYQVSLEGIQPTGKVKPFSSTINGVFHESNLAFDGEDEVYFTRNQKKVYKDVNTGDELRNLMIVRARKTGIGWNVVDDFPYNSEKYSVGHPTISDDGEMMVFISDMPGGFGGTDLYMCIKNELGIWGSPVNLGETVNSLGNEKYPYLHDDNSLYFSSNGLHGLGGQDIHVCPYLNGKFLTPQNLGYPINSSRDDFGFYYDAEKHRGFFTSNRKNGKGSDDIFAYELNDTINYLVKGRVLDVKSKKRVGKLRAKLMDLDDNVIEEVVINDDGTFLFNNEAFRNAGFKVVIEDDKGVYDTIDSGYLKGTGINSGLDLGIMYTEKLPIILAGSLASHKTELGLHGVKLSVFNKDTGEKVGEYFTTDAGNFRFELDEYTKYTIKMEKDGYFTRTVDFETSWERYIDFADLDWGFMEAIEPDIPVILDEYSEINFDYDSYEILPSAEPALNYLAILTLENPYVFIELSAHTDCTGEKAYNQQLSEKRANAAYEYLVIRAGINHEQVVTKGYGESQPLVKCGRRCNKCTMADHALNRRLEFKVLSTDFSQIPEEKSDDQEETPSEDKEQQEEK
ncbi:MAG: OmpA family protein [Flavobacteriales bacterium]|nr:OmpA family protein [Flavobacteriales bacterium]